MITDKDFEIAASDVAAAPVVRRAVKSVKITVGLNPYSDGSGHQQTVTVVRSESGEDKDAVFDITLEVGSDRIDLNYESWGAVRDAVECSIRQASN